MRAPPRVTASAHRVGLEHTAARHRWIEREREHPFGAQICRQRPVPRSSRTPCGSPPGAPPRCPRVVRVQRHARQAGIDGGETPGRSVPLARSHSISFADFSPPVSLRRLSGVERGQAEAPPCTVPGVFLATWTSGCERALRRGECGSRGGARGAAPRRGTEGHAAARKQRVCRPPATTAACAESGFRSLTRAKRLRRSTRRSQPGSRASASRLACHRTPTTRKILPAALNSRNERSAVSTLVPAYHQKALVAHRPRFIIVTA